jgi:hypothetical protein
VQPPDRLARGRKEEVLVLDPAGALEPLPERQLALEHGTEAALRHQIETLERGQPDYSSMEPGLAEAERQQLPQIKDLSKRMGALKSLVFSKLLPNGVDLYVATFEHGQLDCGIAPLSPAGKVVSDFCHQSH